MTGNGNRGPNHPAIRLQAIKVAQKIKEFRRANRQYRITDPNLRAAVERILVNARNAGIPVSRVAKWLDMKSSTASSMLFYALHPEKRNAERERKAAQRSKKVVATNGPVARAKSISTNPSALLVTIERGGTTIITDSVEAAIDLLRKMSV